MDMASQERLNLKLVREVQKYPCLYKTDLVDYSLKSVTDNAWANVGRVVGWPGSKCKEKFKNIRSVVCRYKKLMNAGVKRRPYYLMEPMSYTFPYIKLFNKTSDQKELNVADEPNDTMQYDESFPDDDEFIEDIKIEKDYTPNSSEIQQCDVSYSEKLDDQEDVDTFGNYPTSPEPNKARIDKRQDKNDKNNFQKSGLEQAELNTNVDTSFRSDSMPNLQNDHKKMFILSLLPDIYGMNDTQMRKFKRGVMQLVDDILSDNAKDIIR